MRQSFDVKGGPTIGRKNLPLLRTTLRDMGIFGIYIPHEDEYQNEYLPECNERLAWATGFTGSAGAAIVTQDDAILFVDGRYTLQAEDQVDPKLFKIEALPDPGPFGWLSQQAFSGKVIGYDPRLMTPTAFAMLEAAAARAGVTLKSLNTNPIDRAWKRRPRAPAAKIVPHDLTFAGVASSEKREGIGTSLAADGLDAAVITAPASIAWLFNIRGGDVDYSPLPLGRAILRQDGSAELFVAKSKVTDALRDHLGNEVALRDLKELNAGLRALKGKRVSLDPDLASVWFFKSLKRYGASVAPKADPCLLPKACKNSAELAGTERAHERDAVPIIRFLHWLDTAAQTGTVTEIECVQKLESLRDETGALQDLSFDTISGAGPNGALPHYRVSSASNRKLELGSLYLVDSGGQYLDGTTDITRTVPIGTPSEEMKDRYTRVLKGHIALATVRFPTGTTGTHLDVLARHALWAEGLDYDHGTGHGVGSYLGVHEGPQRIAKPWNATPLQPGMIVSNEPGYYKPLAFGIRIENLQYVTEPESVGNGDRPMMGFHQVTLAPLSRSLIAKEVLNPAEIDWVDDYHKRVWSTLAVRFDALPEVKSWLEDACAPL